MAPELRPGVFVRRPAPTGIMAESNTGRNLREENTFWQTPERFFRRQPGSACVETTPSGRGPRAVLGFAGHVPPHLPSPRPPRDPRSHGRCLRESGSARRNRRGRHDHGRLGPTDSLDHLDHDSGRGTEAVGARPPANRRLRNLPRGSVRATDPLMHHESNVPAGVPVCAHDLRRWARPEVHPGLRAELPARRSPAPPDLPVRDGKVRGRLHRHSRTARRWGWSYAADADHSADAA